MSTNALKTAIVPSFAKGEWYTPEAPAKSAEVLDANTGELLRIVSSDGIDIAGMVDFARTVGQKSLGELTTHQRALKLKELAQYLGERKTELYDISFRTGANKRDHYIDTDGGITTLFVYSSKGRREMPNSNVIIDGKTEVLSRDGSFLGSHIHTCIPGVAVQINAFNFPVWGMLEKFAPSFIAGVPTIVKPATDTGYVTEAAVRMMLESGILPEGSLQLISGSAQDLMDHLDYRDHVAFTGSLNTAKLLRSHSSVQHDGLRFTAEADSLNAAILGPDAVEGSEEFDAFIKAVFVEMTAKAGQKCTAIRRTIVPEALKEPVIAALTARLSDKVTVGASDAEGSTMGPLASKAQQEDVSEATQKLIDGGATVRLGGPQEIANLNADGAFFPPTVLEFSDANANAVHNIEAFGPVTSVISYDGTVEDAVRLAALGAGSLVATVCSNDGDFVAQTTYGIASHHGRVHVLNRETAKTSTGHGSPVPHLVHGGPGRAGGGEELGGVRGVMHYMQRTAIQGSPDMLTAITGVWHQGATANTVTRAAVEDGTGEHPFRKSLETLRIGDQFASDLRTVHLQDILDFAEETGDKFYAHVNEEAAKANPFFPGRVAHGYLLVAWAAGLFVEPAPGPVLANYGLENLSFITPVTYDDAVRVTLTAKQITPRVTDEYGEVRWDAVLHNQNDEIVATYDVLTLVTKTWPSPAVENN